MQYSWLRVGEGSISPQACQERLAALLGRPALAEHLQFWYSVNQYRSRFVPALPGKRSTCFRHISTAGTAAPGVA